MAPPPPWPLVLGALWLGYSRAGAYVLHLETDCPLSATGQVLWANWTLSFNKLPFVCYDNDYGHFLPCGLGATFPWNFTAGPIAQWLDMKAPPQGPAARAACEGQVQSLWGWTGGRHTPPNVRIYRVTPRNTPLPIMITCMAWGFYPQEVDIAWLWNGAPVKDKEGPLTISNNGDWTYQAQRTLPVDPQLGGTYTCRVAHASLAEPIFKDWVPGLSLELRLKVGLAVTVLCVGIIFLTAAIIFWRKRIPQGYIPIDGSTYSEGR